MAAIEKIKIIPARTSNKENLLRMNLMSSDKNARLQNVSLFRLYLHQLIRKSWDCNRHFKKKNFELNNFTIAFFLNRLSFEFIEMILAIFK